MDKGRFIRHYLSLGLPNSTLGSPTSRSTRMFFRGRWNNNNYMRNSTNSDGSSETNLKLGSYILVKAEKRNPNFELQ